MASAWIDLNADVGEGFDDGALMPWISSANVACGGHAGDRETMQRTVALALQAGVRVGAHPGFPDRTSFGRVVTTRDRLAIEDFVQRQVEDLAALVAREGARLMHVKPHGALYNLVAVDLGVANAVAVAVRRFDPELALVGLAGSPGLQAGRAAGLVVIEEGFVDRGYEPDGSLTPRGQPGALIESPGLCCERAVSLALANRVLARDGTSIAVAVQTLCLHGDAPNAAEIACQVRAVLEGAGVGIRPPAPVGTIPPLG